MFVGFGNAALSLVMYLISVSALFGTKLSKKVGTANQKTDEYIEQGKSLSNDLLVKVIWRVAIGLIGLALYYFGTPH